MQDRRLTEVFYIRHGKRLLDLVLVIPAVIVLLPVFSLVALAACLSFGRPVFFLQQRPGYREKSFVLYKLRTLKEEHDSEGAFLPDDKRLTPFGKMLRSLSLDELPQLWNVLKGDISLVGPRPLLMEYLPLYSIDQHRRHDVRPGITGWAQVNGRNALSWEEKFKLDVWYAGNVSFWLDVKILFITVIKVLKRQDISMQGRATMEKFKGNGITHGR
ncbi:MAG: sugar transferase [Deltaproteobacteria bacterium]|nr:sugar transferase [Deltaproteobacteria bacterium]